MYNLAINLTALNKMPLIDYSPYSIINKGVYKRLTGLQALASIPLEPNRGRPNKF